MTTIAWDGTTLAGDSQVNQNEFIAPQRVKKVVKLKDGRIVGMCGTISDFPSFIHFLETGEAAGQLEVTALVAKGRQCAYCEGTRPASPVKAPAAVGSGAAYAIAAMMAGADAKKATQIACRLDTQSGPPVVALNCGGAMDGLTVVEG